MRKFWRQGEPLVWATGGALALTLLFALALLLVVIVNGLGVFWPHALAEIRLADGTKTLGLPVRSDVNPDTGVESVQFKTANREVDPGRQDFHWYRRDQIAETTWPAEACVVERLENGDFYGFVRDVQVAEIETPREQSTAARLDAALVAVTESQDREVLPLRKQLAALSQRLEDLRFDVLKVEYRKRQFVEADPTAATADLDARLKRLAAEQAEMKRESDRLVTLQRQAEAAIRKNVLVLADAAGRTHAVALADVVRVYYPNAMGLPGELWHYVTKLGELVWAEPRESNTEGGLFPAIFGTVMLVFLMAVSCFPLGVMAGVYLGEYAKEGFLVRTVRIAVNNLAGIPSIVYGIFGLGFFIYGIGQTLDRLLFPERVAAGISTFGTGGILWASLTLGLLTIPVVIVSTEEALRTIPRGVREGSLALGATKLQTLLRVLLPMASPGIMTGFILAMARAAGEVAPLMITGVVKLAPALPLDGHTPFFHLDRKFMHLGFHIYDIGFQSPNVEASKPMVYVTTLLLVLIVLAMSSLAIRLRNRMRKRYQAQGI